MDAASHESLSCRRTPESRKATKRSIRIDQNSGNGRKSTPPQDPECGARARINCGVNTRTRGSAEQIKRDIVSSVQVIKTPTTGRTIGRALCAAAQLSSGVLPCQV